MRLNDGFFTHYKTDSGNHTRPCETPNCTNMIHKSSQYRICQSCRDKSDPELVKNFQNIGTLETSINQKKETIEELEQRIKRLKEEITASDKDLYVEKVQIKYPSDLVSDDVRYHDSIDNENGIKWKLETHCTIVRVKNSPENVYFGHVTLVISNNYNLKYKWHYGVEVVKRKIPKNLNHKFWYKHKEYPPEITTVSSFAKFSNIKPDTTLAKIMKNHFTKCISFFEQKHQWENQVWHSDNIIGGERANDLVKRLIQMKKDRKEIDYKTFTDEQLEEKKERKQRYRQEKEFRRLQKQLQLEEAKKNTDNASKRYQDEQAATATRRAEQEAATAARLAEQEAEKAREEAARLAREEAEKAREEAVRLAREEAEKAARLADEQALMIQKAIDESNAERHRLESEPRQNEQAIQYKKSRQFISTKTMFERSLDDIKEAIEKTKRMEIIVKREEEKNHISDDAFTVRNELSIHYSILIEHIISTMHKVQSDNILKDEDKAPILEFLNTNKEELERPYRLLVYKSNNYELDRWLDFHNENIVPKEERLQTLEPTVKEATDIRRLLIKYYRNFNTKIDNFCKFKHTYLTDEEYKNLLRRKLNIRLMTVRSEQRLETLRSLEEDILKKYYEDKKDDFREDHDYIIENLLILYPKYFDTEDSAKRFFQIIKDRSSRQELKRLSTKSILLRFSEEIERRLSKKT